MTTNYVFSGKLLTSVQAPSYSTTQERNKLEDLDYVCNGDLFFKVPVRGPWLLQP